MSCASACVQLRDVEAELEAEQRRGRDVVAENRKLARLLQELRAQADEDHRVASELTETVNSLNLKIAVLKRQLLEAVRSDSCLLFTVSH
jgi:hypothetical protein